MLKKKETLKISLFLLFVVVACLMPKKVSAAENSTRYLYVQVNDWFMDKDELKYNINLPFDAKLSFEFNYTEAELEIPEISYSKILEWKSLKDTGVLETMSIPKETECSIEIKNIKKSSKWPVNCCIYIIPTSDILLRDLNFVPMKNTIRVGETITLEPSYSLDFIPKEEGAWKSSNSKVANVDQDGKITAKSMGTAVITYSLYGKSVKQEISITKMNVNMWKGEKISLKPFVEKIPNYKKGKWKSTNEKIASVNRQGKILLKQSGKAKINFVIGTNKYVFQIFSYDGVKVYNIAYADIYDRLKNPSSYILNDVKCEYDSKFYSEVYLTIDYSAMNGFGGYTRGYYYCIAQNMKYYGEFLD